MYEIFLISAEHLKIIYVHQMHSKWIILHSNGESIFRQTSLHKANFIRCKIRPCIRQNFPNFLFSRVSEMFGCQSSEFFWKKTEFLNSRNFFVKMLGKKFENLISEISLGINRNCTSIPNFLKKLCIVWVFESKNPVFESKNPVFVSKSLVKVRKKIRKYWKQGFPNIRKFQKLFYSEISENYEKMTLNSNFGNCEKLVPTRKFG